MPEQPNTPNQADADLADALADLEHIDREIEAAGINADLAQADRDIERTIGRHKP